MQKFEKTFPEVESVFGKVGRAETATDPAPLSMIETIVRLKPRDQWSDPAKTTRELMQEMDKELRIPGLANAWTMPIITRIDMLSTGIKTPIGIKVSGPDLNVLAQVALNIENIMKKLPETISAYGDRAVGGYFLDITINRRAAARYGLTVGDVQDVIMSAVGGMQVSQTIEGLERYSINVRYPRDFRDNPDKISRVLVPTPGGTHIPLSEVTDIALTRGAPVIKSENARPNAWVYVDISTSDIGGFVRKAKEVMAEELKLPAGYTLIWSGQFEYMKRAQERLRIVVPFTLVLIFLMLYLNFRNLAEPIIVMLSIPFALVGGIWLIWIMNFNLSVAIVVGFIALAGVAAEIGVLVLTFIDHELERQRKNTAGRKMSSKEIMAAVYTGTSERVRPIAMTSIATIAGLLPILYGKGTGSQVMQRIAAPMVGGMVTTTLLCLLVIPVIYGFYLQVGERFRKE